MKNGMRALIFADLTFVMMLAISGMLDGVLSDVVYFGAFVAPIVAILVIFRKELCEDKMLLPKEGTLSLMLPAIAPTVSAVIGLSYLTALLLGLFGIEDELVLEGNYFTALIRYAIFPAVFEELLFRYLPLRLTAGHSGRATVLFSSIFFALVHCSLFQIPYAFIAGIIFITVDMMCGSVLPSVIIHLINNALAVSVYFFGSNEVFGIVYTTVLAALSLVSVLVIILNRRKYIERLNVIFEKKDGDSEVGLNVLLIVIPTLFVAFTNLFAD